MIDAHMHIDFNGWTCDHLLRYMDCEGIEKAWLLSWEEVAPALPRKYQNLTVQNIFKAYHAYPDRFVPMYAPDPRRADMLQSLRYWQQMGIRGCGELKVALSWNEPQVHALLEYINELKMPLTFHMERGRTIYATNSKGGLRYRLGRLLESGKYQGVPRCVAETLCMFPPMRQIKESMALDFPGYLSDHDHLEMCLNKYPNISFIGHGPMFWEEMVADRARTESTQDDPQGKSRILLETYANLMADLSGPSCYRVLSGKHFDAGAFFSRFSSKLIYGTDNFMLGMKELILAKTSDKEVHKNIFHENAKRLVG